MYSDEVGIWPIKYREFKDKQMHMANCEYSLQLKSARTILGLLRIALAFGGLFKAYHLAEVIIFCLFLFWFVLFFYRGKLTQSC